MTPLTHKMILGGGLIIWQNAEQGNLFYIKENGQE